MLWTIFVILLVLWLLGLVTGTTFGGLVHILIVIAIIVLGHPAAPWPTRLRKTIASQREDWKARSSCSRCGPPSRALAQTKRTAAALSPLTHTRGSLRPNATGKRNGAPRRAPRLHSWSDLVDAFVTSAQAVGIPSHQ